MGKSTINGHFLEQWVMLSNGEKKGLLTTSGWCCPRIMVHDEWNRHPKRNPARSTTSLPWRVKVLHDTAGMQPVSFSSCHSLSPNERFAATARIGPTYWDVQANAARSRRWKLWADVTGHPCKSTRGGQRHEIRSSQLLNATKDCPSIFALQRDAKGLQHPLQFNAGPFATSRRQSRSQQLPSFRSSRAPSTSTAFNNQRQEL